MPKRYRCIIGFGVPKCDDDGFEIPHDLCVIEKGSIWEETDLNMLGAEVHLAEVGKPWHWLDITKEHLARQFKEIKE